jgi:hypothetical protein
MSHWYLFRSREVADITSHMTADEELSFRAEWRSPKWVMGAGVLSGILGPLLIPKTISAIPFSFSGLFHFLGAALIVFLPVGLILGLSLAYATRKKMRAFLCSTEYARQAGYREDSLRLYRFWF